MGLDASKESVALPSRNMRLGDRAEKQLTDKGKEWEGTERRKSMGRDNGMDRSPVRKEGIEIEEFVVATDSRDGERR